MPYIVNQYNHPVTQPTSANSLENTVYMKVLGGGTPKRKKNTGDRGVTGGGSLDPFFDECVVLDSALVSGKNYYLHTKIKRLNSPQIFYIYLINYDDSGGGDTKTQYLKTITVQSGSQNQWVDFELVFTPLIQFDCILFQLQRTIEDYRIGTRYPTIVYEELSLLDNLISNKIKQGISLIKFGIQSRPGLMMCINGNEIHIGRTGIYEMRNGLISVSFLSVVKGSIPDINGSNPIRIDGIVVPIESLLGKLAYSSPIEGANATNSVCIFDNSKLRAIDSFTLDYMYKEE